MSVNTRTSACDLGGIGGSFGTADGFQIQVPLVKRLSTALTRQISVQLLFGLRESILSILSRTPSSIIRVLHFLYELLDLSAQGRMRLVPAILSGRRFISRFDLIAPVGFRRLVQLVQRRIGGVRHFSHGALAEQPGEHRPLHGFGHQGSGLVDFGKLSHGEKNIATPERKVQPLFPAPPSLRAFIYG